MSVICVAVITSFFNEKYNIIRDDSGEEITENKVEDGQVRFSGAIQWFLQN